MKKHYESPALLVTRIELGVFGDYGCGGDDDGHGGGHGRGWGRGGRWGRWWWWW